MNFGLCNFEQLHFILYDYNSRKLASMSGVVFSEDSIILSSFCLVMIWANVMELLFQGGCTVDDWQFSPSYSHKN